MVNDGGRRRGVKSRPLTALEDEEEEEEAAAVSQSESLVGHLAGAAAIDDLSLAISLFRSVTDVTDQQCINRSDRLCSFVLFLVLLFLNKARPCVSRCVVDGWWWCRAFNPLC